MDATFLIMWVGFILAAYSVIGNDVIQTLGTFLSSNEQRPWYVLWAFAGTILTITLVYGWTQYGGDVSYGRLEKYPFIEDITWPYLLPPLVLMLLTRTGIPVSTSFLVLTFFKPKGLYSMTMKSILGYALAFCIAIIIWQLITRKLDKRFIDHPPSEINRMNTSVLVGVAVAVSGLFLFYLGLDIQGILISLTAGIGAAAILSRFNQNIAWTALQWGSTGFLWGQWLIQDFANIYVYLPRALSGTEILVSMIILLSLLGYIFYSKGGAIQKIVKAKTNTVDIRSATIVDFVYGIVLLFFKEFSNVPMSTTWVFLGLLAGREIAIRYRLELIKEPSDIVKAPIYHYLGQALNVIIILLIGYVVYLRDQVPDLIIIVMALVMILRAFVVYMETIPGRFNLKSAYRDIGWDLSKVTLGLVISIVLVKVMQWLTGVGL
jgi:Co/Zn/Cd efflux system component